MSDIDYRQTILSEAAQKFMATFVRFEFALKESVIASGDKHAWKLIGIAWQANWRILMRTSLRGAEPAQFWLGLPKDK